MYKYLSKVGTTKPSKASTDMDKRGSESLDCDQPRESSRKTSWMTMMKENDYFGAELPPSESSRKTTSADSIKVDANLKAAGLSLTMMMMKKEAPLPDYFGAELSVWWDMDKCPIPDGYDAWKVGPCIRSELQKLGYHGTITIFGVGNLRSIPQHVLHALFSAGMVLKHVPSEISQATLLSSMLYWQLKHPAPVSVMLITDSGTFDMFSYSICKMQEKRKCNILLAYQDSLERDYSLVTHEHWFWRNLLKDARCSEIVGEFSCLLCNFVCQSFEEVTKHLKEEYHETESLRVKCGDPMDEYDETGVGSSRPSRKQPMRKAKKMKYERLSQELEGIW